MSELEVNKLDRIKLPSDQIKILNWILTLRMYLMILNMKQCYCSEVLVSYVMKPQSYTLNDIKYCHKCLPEITKVK